MSLESAIEKLAESITLLATNPLFSTNVNKTYGKFASKFDDAANFSTDGLARALEEDAAEEARIAAAKDQGVAEDKPKAFERRAYGWDSENNEGAVYEKGDFPLEGYDGVKKSEFLKLCEECECDPVSGLKLKTTPEQADGQVEDELEDLTEVEAETEVDELDELGGLDELVEPEAEVEAEPEVTDSDIRDYVQKIKKDFPEDWKSIVSAAFKAVGASNFSEVEDFAACLKAVKAEEAKAKRGA